MIGRPVQPTVDFRMAKYWLDDCCQTHKDCSQGPSTRLSTRSLGLLLSHIQRWPRFLDLGAYRSSENLRLSARGWRYGRYAALSHCWGTPHPLQLTKENFGVFQTEIVFTSLPRMFQDAVIATRILGLRYLWIDSLCIIQDSKSDWEDQCSKMAEIYANSYVTLAGPAAPDCNSGFLHKRPIPYQLHLKLSDGEDEDRIALAHEGVQEYLWDEPEANSTLARRAWALQERLLSRRILYFGNQGMYFECFTLARFENIYHPNAWEKFCVGSFPKSSLKDFTASDRFSCWNRLVEVYSHLNLTHATDRLPALSGLASNFQRATGARYLAGIWQEDIYRALAWQVEMRPSREPPIISTSECIAPSWSWAAAKWGVCFPFAGFPSRAKILNYHIATKGRNPFGEVENGWIDLRAKVQKFHVHSEPSVGDFENQRIFVIHPSEDSSQKEFRFMPDDDSTLAESEFEVMLLSWTQGSTLSVALAIEPIDEKPNAFRRIGLAHDDITYTQNKVPDLFIHADERTIRLF